MPENLQIKDASLFLRDRGLLVPEFDILHSDREPYTALLLQPGGEVAVSDEKIGNADSSTARIQATRFLKQASQSRFQLAVTPEYYLPWESLKESILEGHVPAPKALWVLGCESITEQQLEFLHSELEVHCSVVYEDTASLDPDRKFFDPVVLLFQATQADGTSRLVALVQFKTFASADDRFLEQSLLRRGSAIYQFVSSDRVRLSVAAIICSDALNIHDDDLPALINDATLIHIQLNPKPMHPIYRKYRATAFLKDPAVSRCHIVCLNWTQRVSVAIGSTTELQTVAGSTWYCPVADCSSEDIDVFANHRQGLYYAYMKEHRHALFFHEDSAVFELTVPKVVRDCDAVMSDRRGPRLLRRYLWDGSFESWSIAPEDPESGFLLLINGDDYLDARHALREVMTDYQPLRLERLFALSTGDIKSGDEWFRAPNIDSCTIKEDEVVHRMTVVREQGESPRMFRHHRLNTVAQIQQLILNRNDWPPQVAGVDENSVLSWKDSNPQFNTYTVDGKPTLVVFLGDKPSSKDLETKIALLYTLVSKAEEPYRKRLCIAYRKYDNIEFAPIPPLTRFDQAIPDTLDITATDLNDVVDQ